MHSVSGLRKSRASNLKYSTRNIPTDMYPNWAMTASIGKGWTACFSIPWKVATWLPCNLTFPRIPYLWRPRNYTHPPMPWHGPTVLRPNIHLSKDRSSVNPCWVGICCLWTSPKGPRKARIVSCSSAGCIRPKFRDTWPWWNLSRLSWTQQYWAQLSEKNIAPWCIPWSIPTVSTLAIGATMPGVSI